LPAQRRDARADWINQSNLRNDIRLFEFDEKAASFGTAMRRFMPLSF
jgi:hypothetical protein